MNLLCWFAFVLQFSFSAGQSHFSVIPWLLHECMLCLWEREKSSPARPHTAECPSKAARPRSVHAFREERSCIWVNLCVLFWMYSAWMCVCVVLFEWGGDVSEFDRHFLSTNTTAPSKIKSGKKIWGTNGGTWCTHCMAKLQLSLLMLPKACAQTCVHTHSD